MDYDAIYDAIDMMMIVHVLGGFRILIALCGMGIAIYIFFKRPKTKSKTVYSIVLFLSMYLLGALDITATDEGAPMGNQLLILGVLIVNIVGLPLIRKTTISEYESKSLIGK